jgi:hypothetical protein
MSIIIAACLGILGCGGSSGGPNSGGGPSPGGGVGQMDERPVYEAAFRHLLVKYPKDVEGYLALDSKDVPATVLDKLRKDWPKLKQISEMPKEKGLWLYVDNLKWTGHHSAELKAGHWSPTKFAGEGASGTYHMQLKDSKWVVEKITDVVMS